MLFPYDYDFGMQPTQRELALTQDLGVSLLVRVLHDHDDLGLLRVGDEIHGTSHALDLA
jgi:hypothetical protein